MPFMEGKNDLTHSPQVLGVVENGELRRLFDGLFATSEQAAPEPPYAAASASITFDYKWLRAVPPNAYTGAHLDWVYMGRGCKELLTCWIPIGDNPVEMGSLAMLNGSHSLPGFQHLQATYGEMDCERVGLDGSGWFTEDPEEVAELDPHAQWLTADFEAGDIMIFTMRTLHMSTTNISDRARVSCDVRWQPAAAPCDPRYVGQDLEDKTPKSPSSLGGKVVDETSVQKRTVFIEELKQQWGFLPFRVEAVNE
eukprot:gene4196-5172_t